MRRRLISYLYPSYLLVTFAALLGTGGFASFAIREFYHKHLENDLIIRAQLLTPLVLQELHQPPESMRAQVLSWAEWTGAHVTVLYPDGRVIADSEVGGEKLVNQIDRPEIREAKRTGQGRALGYSPASQSYMMYAALPAYAEEEMAAVIRLGVPLTFIQRSLWTLNVRLLLGGAVIAMLAAVVCWFVSQRIASPLDAMRRSAGRFAEGTFSERMAVPVFQEFASLAEAMNHMASQLDERIRTIVGQRNLQEAVLASMVEGVIAVNNSDTIVAMNEAAGKLLGVDVEESSEHRLADVIRNVPFRRFVTHVRHASGPIEDEIVIHERDEQVLYLHGAVLRDAQGIAIGAVIVLHDITRLRRLERVRRDFVANVSHELRTPITSIKGFVETIQEHALNNPEEMARFLAIVAKQSDRLASILDDLLVLSRMDQEDSASDIALEVSSLKGVLTSAVQVCAHSANERGVHVALECNDTASARINGPLLEQALTNLLDNAIKYSGPGTTVVVSVSHKADAVAVSVRDTGCGIAAEHLPRLFERFYRVDKARSRAMGGTGLGLAIVKHIVLAHRGRVEVESTPGKGSTFTVILPRV